jgi:hypothetical protein
LSIKLLIDSKLLTKAKEALMVEEFKIKKEVAWIFANILENDEPDQVKHLFELNIFEVLCDLLKFSNDALVSVLLTALARLLDFDSDHNDKMLADRIQNHREESKLISWLLKS